PGDFAAVYIVEQVMTPYTGFTRDREVLRAAIEKIAITPPAERGLGSPGGVAESASTEAAGGVVNRSRSEQGLTAMRGRMDTGLTDVSNQLAAGAEGAAFSQLIADLDRFPGRRSVILFSEGLTWPLVATRLESVADKAAPKHVSFYTIAPGLGRPYGKG